MTTKKRSDAEIASNAPSRLARLSDQVEQVVDAVASVVVDALPDAVTAPLTGPMIVRVTTEHQHKLYEHMLRLSDSDRYLRFGFAITDESLRIYAFGIDLDYDDVFAVLDPDLQVVAMAHISYENNHTSTANVAEFGVSVDAAHRNKHYGYALLHRCIVHARARKVSRFYIHALSQNVAMLSLARKVAMTIEINGDETTGNLLLPPADLSTLVDYTLADGRATVELGVRKRTRWIRQLRAGDSDKKEAS